METVKKKEKKERSALAPVRIPVSSKSRWLGNGLDHLTSKDNAPDGYEKPNMRQCREFNLMSSSSPQDLRDQAVRIKIQ